MNASPGWSDWPGEFQRGCDLGSVFLAAHCTLPGQRLSGYLTRGQHERAWNNRGWRTRRRLPVAQVAKSTTRQERQKVGQRLNIGNICPISSPFYYQKLFPARTANPGCLETPVASFGSASPCRSTCWLWRPLTCLASAAAPWLRPNIAHLVRWSKLNDPNEDGECRVRIRLAPFTQCCFGLYVGSQQQLGFGALEPPIHGMERGKNERKHQRFSLFRWIFC